MRGEEIKEELELGVRCFLDAQERSFKNGLDEFDEIRILEAAFNRLFLAVEHICNAIILFETGNYSKKHFGDFEKFKKIKEKYGLDLVNAYQQTYSFRAYGDYRKFPEIEEKFDREHLKKEIAIIKGIAEICLQIFKDKIKVDELIGRLIKGTEGFSKKEKVKARDKNRKNGS